MNPKEKPAVQSSSQEPTRRKVVQTAAWMVPAVVTLAVTPSFAGTASGKEPEPRP